MAWIWGISRFIFFFLLLFFALGLAGCSSYSFAPVKQGVSVSQISGKYRVQPGDTLYSIAWSYDKDYRVLARINHIAAPYAIHPGQTIILKPRIAKLVKIRQPKHAIPRPKAQHKRVKQAKKTKHKRRTYRTASKNHRQHALGRVRHWYWPANGKIIRSYAPHKGNKGINIAGKVGSPVRASAAGIVVYRGNGIRGYGKLIIIKHNPRYLSAYAHNQKILVKEGQYVKADQIIAYTGKSGRAKRAMLHFEIRRAGKPVNPLCLLAQR